jgi:hypothetical protein
VLPCSRAAPAKQAQAARSGGKSRKSRFRRLQLQQEAG